MSRVVGLALVVFLGAPAALVAQPPKQAPPAAAPKTQAKPPVKRPPAKKPAQAPDKTEPAAKVVAPPPAPPPDLEVTSRYVTADKTTIGTVVMHGARQRVEYQSGFASIQQCDEGRGLQLNTQTRAYLVMPYAPATPAAAPAGAKQKGGRITYTTSVVDTGERKEMFGLTARHLKTTVVKQSSPDACDKKPEQVETDGWYVDVPASLTCAAAPQLSTEIRVDPRDSSCRDEVSYVRPDASPGYPLAYIMTAASGTEAPARTSMEATDVKRLTADPQLFDVPADYIEVRTPTQLTADHRPGEEGPKKPGEIRVGIAPVVNKSGQSIGQAELTQALVESFSEGGTDAILLRSTQPADLAAEAAARSCDFILTSTVAEVKQAGKGLMGKIGGSSPDGFAAKVEFALAVPGGASAAYSGSEKSGSSMLQTAVGAARRVSQFVTPFGT